MKFAAVPELSVTPDCVKLPRASLRLYLTNLHLLKTCSISYPESIGDEIEKKCNSVFPLQNCFIRKVKVLKRPRFDLTKLMELHGDSTGEDSGAAMDKIAAETTVKKLAGAGGRL